MLAAELDDLLDDVSLLVDLDRVDGRVAAGVLELRGSADSKRSLSCSMRDRRMSEKRSSTGQRDALLLEVHREVVQVERVLRAIRIRAHDDMSVRVDVEEAGAPPVDVVERFCVSNRPFRRRRCRWRWGGRGFWGPGARHGANYRDFRTLAVPARLLPRAASGGPAISEALGNSDLR